MTKKKKIEFIKEFVNPSVIHEQIFVGYLWANPYLYEQYKKHTIEKSSFTERIWYFYFLLGKMMYDGGVRTFDDVTTYSFLTSMPIEKEKKIFIKAYDEYGGYETIQEIKDECSNDKQNSDYHFSEIQKYESLRLFQQDGLIDVKNNDLVNSLVQMNLKQMQMFMQHKIQKAFSHVNSGEVVEHNLLEGLSDVIKRMNDGEGFGISIFDAPRLNKAIKGIKDGNLTYIVMASGVGKSSFTMEKFIISLIENDEKGMIFGNEESAFKFQSLLLATVASRKLRKAINREKLAEGNFDSNTLSILNEAKDWLETHKQDIIKFFELKRYRVEDIISRIELYRPLGYKYALIDTFKPSMNSGELARWEAFSNNAQELFDCIKEDANNVGTWATVQMKIGKQYRFLDLESIGKSMEIVEVAGVVILFRPIFSDEYPEERNALECYNWEKSEIDGKWHKKEYELNPDKKYVIGFLAKNRFGNTDQQIVYEVNYGINAWKEVCYTLVPNTGNNY